MHGTESNATGLIVLGLLLLGGYVAHLTSRRFPVPKVSLLLVVGVICGPSLLDLVPDRIIDWFPFVSKIALAMVGFLLGESFAGKHLKETGGAAFAISISKAIVAAVVVLFAARLVGASWPVALLLGGIAPASAPAAAFEAIRGTHSDGPLSRTVMEIVAIDDAWGIIIFSILLVVAQTITGDADAWAGIGDGLWKVGGAIGLGAALGFPMAWITSHIREGEATLVEAGGFVLLCAGAAEALGVSYLLAAMTLGTVMSNFVSDNARPFYEVERVREPFLAVFFLLAGLKFEAGALTGIGLIGAAYIAARTAAFFAASWTSAKIVSAHERIRRNIGWCILTQAGVALGLALIAEEEVPQAQSTVLPLIIASTIIFEITGPILLRWRLRASGEIGRAEEPLDAASPSEDAGPDEASSPHSH